MSLLLLRLAHSLLGHKDKRPSIKYDCFLLCITSMSGTNQDRRQLNSLHVISPPSTPTYKHIEFSSSMSGLVLKTLPTVPVSWIFSKVSSLPCLILHQLPPVPCSPPSFSSSYPFGMKALGRQMERKYKKSGLAVHGLMFDSN